MQKEDYDKISSVLPMAGVLDTYMAMLRNSVQDAVNQAENGSELGMAVAIGRVANISDELFNAWLSVKGGVE